VYSVTVTVNGCTSAAGTTDVTIIPNTPTSVLISANPGSTICAGTSVTFTATPTGGGTTPSYQWQVNGANVGTNSNTFTSTTLSNADRVTVLMTSNAVCPLPATATSNQISMTVNDLVIPSVSIAESVNDICPGTSITFTASPINGGPSPTYQWKVDGVNVGTNSPTFSSSSLTDGQLVTVEMTSNAVCASPAVVASTGVEVNVLPVPVPAVSIAESVNDICPGTSVTFTATPTNGGTSPTYQWKINGANVGTNSPTFTTTTLTNGQIVTVELTSNAPCANPVSVTSTGITMNVLPAPVPAVSIVASASPICPGNSVTFTATPTNGGSNPSYQWKLNGANIGTNANTYTTSSLVNGDQVSVVMTSDAPCATPATATSNVVSMVVNPPTPITPGAITGIATQCVSRTGLTYSITAVPNATSYTWTVPSGWTITAGATTNSITVSTTGTAVSGNITVTATNSCGTSAASILAVTTVPGVPSQPDTIRGPTTVCPTKNLTYTIDPVPGATGYTWTVPAGWTITSGQGTTSLGVTANINAVTGNITVVASNVCGNSTVESQEIIIGSPKLYAGPDQYICVGTNSITLAGDIEGTINGNNEYTWVVSQGNISSPIRLNSTYTLPVGYTTGTIPIILRSNVTTIACPVIEDTMLVIVRPLPTASLSVTPSICTGTSTTVSFTATPNTVISYRVGTGAVQTIAVGAGGTATLNTGNLTATTTYNLVSVAYPNAATCVQNLTSNATIIVASLPTVNPGPAISVCQSATPAAITLSGVTLGGSATTAAWSITSGGGSLSNTAQTANPSTVTYSPAPNFSGTVTLTITTGGGPCPPATATRTITVTALPTVEAGGPNEVCQSATPTAITLSGATVGGGATTGAWTITSGGGTLSSNNVQTATPGTVTYTPAVNFTGTVTLTLTTNAPGGCAAVTDTRTIEVRPLPIVTAGPAQTICSDGTATMAATIGGGATSGTWTSSGTGTFSNNSPTAVYTPSATDINAGSVTLTYTTNDPAGPCVAATASTTLTINRAVTITSQPANFGVCAGFPADFTVVATGTGLTYQWYKGTAPGGTAVTNSANITGAQTANLHFNQVALSDDGSYYVVVSGTAPCAPVTSAVRTLNVDQAIVITAQPVASTVCIGEDVSFSVVANANGDPLTYQWRKNGTAITGATSPTLTISGVDAADAGNYDVIITGPAGYTCSSIISTAAALTVTPDATLTLSSAAGTDAQTTCVSAGAITPITYAVGGSGTGASLTSGALPAGLTGAYSNGVFTISGTPTAPGSFSYTITTAGPCENVSLSGTITVDANSTLSLTSGAGSNNRVSCEAVALSPITYAIGGGATGVTVTGLPAGITANTSAGLVTIGGTPTVTGSFPYTIVTTGPCINQTLTGSITINQNSTLALTTGSNTQSVCANTPITNIAYTFGGGATNVSVSGLPAGVTGTVTESVLTISGIPTAYGTFNYTVQTSGPCVNTNLTGTLTVAPVPVGGNITPAVTTVCSGSNSGTLTLSGHTGAVVRWESSTNGGSTWTPVSNTSTTQSYSNLTQTISYRAVIEGGVCPDAYSSIAVVSVIPPVPPTSVLANPPAICEGECTVLSAVAEGFPGGWMDVQAFNSANLDQNEGWSATYNGAPHNIEASADNEVNSPWNLTNPIDPFGVVYDNPDQDKYAVATGSVTTTMMTPVFNLIGLNSAVFTFQQAYDLKAGASIKVEISTDGGATYQSVPLMEIIGPATLGNPFKGWPTASIDLSNYLGLSNLKIRWSYTGSPNSIWAIDNAGINPPPLPLTYNWTLLDPAGVPSPYYLNVTNQPTVTACPPNAGTYTYQVSTAYGVCPGGTMDVVVVVHPIPVCDITGATNVCPGSTNVYTGPTGTGYTYQWTVTGDAIISGSSTGQTVTIVAGNLCGQYTVSLVTTANNCPSTPCELIVTVEDNEAPVVTGSLGTLDLSACDITVIPAAATTVAGLEGLGITITDNCTADASLVVAFMDAPAAGTCPIVVVRTYTITDICGNILTLTQTFNVDDTEAPVITGSLPVLNLEGCAVTDAQAAMTTISSLEAAGLTITDNCTSDAALLVSSNDVGSGTCPIVVTRTYTITDACGNFSTAVQTINIDDTQAPVWTTVAGSLDVTLECSDAAGLTAAQAAAPVATDVCDNSLTPVKVAGSFVALANGCGGTYTNTWTVVDDCGNVSEVFTQVITIEDTEAPVLTGVLPGGAVGDACLSDPSQIPPAPTLASIAALYTDNCATVTAVLVSTTDVGTDCSWTRTYTYTVTDGCNPISVDVVFTGGDVEVPVVTGLAEIPHLGCNPVDPAAAFVTPSATDNCGTPTILSGYPQTSAITLVGCDASQTRIWIFVDACNNQSEPFEQVIRWTAAPAVTFTPP
ncbi:S-layer family protein, partial [Flavihumibacter sp. ZG627]|uniref:beta strand repeat-containing protein n=1 Tax=Flavihumibacter sp. ZG627 TaxID=1463156 RepID=UPI0012E01FF9